MAASNSRRHRSLKTPSAEPLEPRSPFLQALPKSAGLDWFDRARVVSRRAATAAAVLSVLAWLAWGVLTNRFDIKGPAWPLFWIHDHVLLPCVGYVWTLHLPYSLIWNGVLAIGLGGAFVSTVGYFSWIRGAHKFYTRRVVRKPSRRQRLLNWHERTRQGRFRPIHLEEIARHEYDRALEAVSGIFRESSRPVPRSDQQQLVHQARLHAGFVVQNAEGRNPGVAAMNLLFSAYLQLKYETGEPDPSALAELRKAMLELRQPPETRGFFGGGALLAEARRLISTDPTEAAERLRALRWVAERVTGRRVLCDRIRIHLEHKRRREQRPATKVETTTRECGRLALLVALEVSSDPAAPADLGTAYLESVEGLAFAVDMSADRLAPDLAAFTRAVAVFDHDLYRLAARLLDRQRGVAAPVAELPRTAGGLFTRADFEIGVEAVEILWRAAGEDEARP